jgi:hypothetical protein
MSIDVMIVGPAEDIARPGSIEMMESLHERWQEFEIPYGFVELDQNDIEEVERRFANDPVGRMLLKKVADNGSSHADEPIELMISY